MALGSVLKSLFTVELQICSDLFFFRRQPDRIQHQFDTLAGAGFVGSNA